MSLRNQPYLPLYVNDFLADEKLSQCSAAANGVYIRLMCLMHKSEEYGRICYSKNDVKTDNITADFAIKLSRQMPYSYEEILAGLEELLHMKVVFFSGKKLVQKRMENDGKLSEKRAKSGKKGMSNRWKSEINEEKICYNKIDNKTITNTEYEIEYESEVINHSLERGFTREKTKNGEPEKSSQEFAGSRTETEHAEKSSQDVEVAVLDVSFENVWALYGRKGNKKTSRQKWDKLKNHCKLAALKHIPAYVAATPDIQFRKNFETYINQEVWEDQIVTKNGTKNGLTGTENATAMGSGYSGNGANPFRGDAQQRRREREVLYKMAEGVLQQSDGK